MKAGIIAVAAGVAVCAGTAAWAQAPAPAAAPEPLWKTTVAAGANVTRGNSETMMYNGSVVSTFKQDKNEARVGAEANYGQNQVTQGSGTNAIKKTDTNVNNARGFGECCLQCLASRYTSHHQSGWSGPTAAAHLVGIWITGWA